MEQFFSKQPRHFAYFLLTLILCLILTACGGGSSSSSSSSGGGSSSGGSASNPCTPYSGATPSASNVVNVSIDCAVFGAVNEPFVSITLCSPVDTANCMTIDHILVDTGSTGLRILAAPSTTAAISTLGLPAQTVAGNALWECQQFVQGNTWGPVLQANLQIGGETAHSVAIQVINSSTTSPTAPAACTSSGSVISTPAGFGANGVLGIGITLQDCGTYCVFQANDENVYFSCTSGGCSNIGVPLNQQIQNPVSLFAKDNNGVILSLNSIAANGAATAGGTLTFGIDTESNNVSANNNTIVVDPTQGTFTTTFEGQTYANSYIDSGSNGFYFNPASNEAITQCSGNSAGFYCPALTLSGLTAQITGLSGSSTTATVSFTVANADTLFDTNNAAFTTLAGTATDIPSGKTFDWGIPFFFGNNIYVAFDGAQTTKASGPYFGF